MSTLTQGSGPLLSRNNRTGLVIAAVLGLGDMTAAFLPASEGESGDRPPVGVIVLGFILGLLTIGLVVRAWKSGHRKTIRGIAALRIFSAVTGLPAFFVDVPAWVKALVAVAVLATLVSVVLMLGHDKRTDRITD